MKQLWMDWQTFAEEAGDAGQETGAVEGGQAAPDAGEQDDFAELIRGRYKAQFDARVQKILDGRLRGLRQENARLRQETQAHRERQAGALLRRQVYPDFDWKRELASPQFGRLVTAGVDGQTAYEIAHRQEFLKAAMAYAAAQARSQTARAIASGGGRVAENRGGSRTVTRSDPKSLSSRELADIRRRVQDGEKIRF